MSSLSYSDQYECPVIIFLTFISCFMIWEPLSSKKLNDFVLLYTLSVNLNFTEYSILKL